MSKRGERARRAELAESIAEIAGNAGNGHDGPIADEIVATLGLVATRADGLPQMKKFRFQLLHAWIVAHIAPCRVADIGGGKGLLAYLLQRSGWDATVIDPARQPLPDKFKDLETGRQIKVGPDERVPRLDRPFASELAGDFDLLIAMHAHGCNIQIIDTAAETGKGFLLLPCCIIGEPIRPDNGAHWLQCVIAYAAGKGFAVRPFRLNFKGQNIGFYAPPF